MRAMVRQWVWIGMVGTLLVGIAPLRAGADYIIEVRSETAVFPFQQYVYFCDACTPADLAAVVPPAGHVKADPKIFLPNSSVGSPFPPPPGVPGSFDLVPGIPGDDFVLVAEILGSTVIGAGLDPVTSTTQFLTLSRVQRQTTFTYNAGEVVHVATDADGKNHILFGFNVGRPEDVTQLDALAALPLPFGWTYSSFVLTEDFVPTTNGVANVFGIGNLATWQRVQGLPEPGLAGLLVLAALALKRRDVKRRDGVK